MSKTQVRCRPGGESGGWLSREAGLRDRAASGRRCTPRPCWWQLSRELMPAPGGCRAGDMAGGLLGAGRGDGSLRKHTSQATARPRSRDSAGRWHLCSDPETARVLRAQGSGRAALASTHAACARRLSGRVQDRKSPRTEVAPVSLLSAAPTGWLLPPSAQGDLGLTLAWRQCLAS